MDLKNEGIGKITGQVAEGDKSTQYLYLHIFLIMPGQQFY